MRKRGADMAELRRVIARLCEQQPLEARYSDHPLAGRYTGFRECHIKPDWLLIYTADEERLVLTAVRTGTHADLFDD